MAESDPPRIIGKRSHRDEDLDSEFDFGERKRNSWRNDPMATSKPSHLFQVPSHSAAVPSKEFLTAERDKEEWRARRYHYLAMDAYSRHKALVNQYLLSCGHGIEHLKRPTEKDRNDYTILEEEHKFLWEPGEENPQTWEKRLAKAYYDKLFKEYAIADLSRYKENMLAMRWRVEKEVCDGKGQFVCGNKHCSRTEELTSWEVNFSYVEHGEHKNALVKLRLCPKCSKKLNYHKKRRKWGGEKGTQSSKKLKSKKQKKHRHKEKRKKKRKEEKRHAYSSREETSLCASESSSSGGDSQDESEEAESDREKKEPETSGDIPKPSGSDIWNKPVEAFLEKSKVEEFEDYFKDMLL